MIEEGMRFEQYIETFQSLKAQTLEDPNMFRPQKVGSKVKILAGVDEGKYAISILSETYDIDLSNTQLIKVRQTAVSRNKMATIFTLTDEDLLSIFISFAIDLESIVEYDNDVTIVEIYNRYLYWQKMFKTDAEIISEAKVKGLINELLILSDFLIPKFGIDVAIKGWMGTENTHKDFAFSDGTWYEAKAINKGKPVVKISSIEQLEAEQIGMLVISEFEKTSPQNAEGVRLFELLSHIKSKIDLENTKTELIEKIFKLGFSSDIFHNKDHKANQYRFLVNTTNFYKVDDAFPRLTRSNLSSKIGLVSYEIIISEIEEFKVDFS